MKKQLCILIQALTLTGWIAAQSPARVMVLKVSGPVSTRHHALLTGEVLEQGAKIDLTGPSNLTLLLINRGQRVEIQGQGHLEVVSEGVQLSSGLTSVVVDSNQQKLSLTGDNQRNIGGALYRTGRALQLLKDSPFDRIEVLEAESGLRISRPAEAGEPPRLQFSFLPRYEWPAIHGDQVSIQRPLKLQSVYDPLVAGEAQGDRWVWEVPWPQLEAQRFGLFVTPEEGDEPLLYTLVYRTTPQEESELQQARGYNQEWVRREPASIQPMVVYASLLEERGRLEEANSELTRARQLDSQDAGLLAMQIRVLRELGRYTQASRLK